MNKTQIQQLRLGLVLLVFLALLVGVRLMLGSRPSGPSVVVVPHPARSAQVQTPETKSSTSSTAEQIWVASRDPFQVPSLLKETIRENEIRRKTVDHAPVDTSQADLHQFEQTPTLKLQGIFWGGARPLALINRKIVSDGDSIDGATVVKVTKEGVTVAFGGQETQLTLPRRASEGENTSGWSSQLRQPY